MSFVENPRGKRSRRPRKESRTIPLRGYGDDAGLWYRCWNCGFICNSKRDALGDRDSQDGTVHTEYVARAEGATPGEELSPYSVMRALTGTFVSLTVDVDGSGIPPYDYHAYDVGGTGCPLCHSLNWRGDY